MSIYVYYHKKENHARTTTVALTTVAVNCLMNTAPLGKAFLFFLPSSGAALGVEEEKRQKVHKQCQNNRDNRLARKASGGLPHHVRNLHFGEAAGDQEHHNGENQAHTAEQHARDALGEPPGLHAAHAEIAAVAEIVVGLPGGQKQIGKAQYQQHHRPDHHGEAAQRRQRAEEVA